MGGQNNFRNVREKSSSEDKVNWLVENKGYWAYEYKERFVNKEILVGAMKQAGLVAPSTYWKDVKVGRLMDAAWKRIQS